MMKPLLISILLLLLLHGAFAEDKHPIDKSFEECIDNSKCITSEMIRCGEEAFVGWKAEMNKYYNSLMDVLKEESKEQLRKSQEAWGKFSRRGRFGRFKFLTQQFTKFLMRRLPAQCFTRPVI